MTNWQSRDLAKVWHPCTQMKDHEEHPPIVVERGEGVYLYGIDGKRYLDAVSSWWVNLFGHANPFIARAVAEQAGRLEQVIFSHFSHPGAITLAEKITALLPSALTRVFFADNGSAAVEVALKLSFQYHQQTGRQSRKRLIKLTDAYHGETLGALAMGDLDLYAGVFKPLMFEAVKVQGPDCYRCPYGKNRDSCDAECFISMQKELETNGHNTSAVIIEPLVQAAAGMKIYPAVYLKKLREATRHAGVHLITDEIAVGFGRTGTLFAIEQAGITPDFICLSKGLTGGFLPLALTVTTDEIYHAFYADYTELRAFMHSHSYTGNPIACAAALASLSIFENSDILGQNREKARLIRKTVEELLPRYPMVGEYRSQGMIGALELVKDQKTKEGFDWKERVGYRIYRIALEKGLLLRPLGNVLYFMPPYVITPEEIKWMVNTAFESIGEYFSNNHPE